MNLHSKRFQRLPIPRGHQRQTNKKKHGKIRFVFKAEGSCSTFLSHLVEVGKILENWKVPQDIVLLGIYHSLYGNKWISTDLVCERKELESLIGPEAEKLVFQFCRLDRMKFMFQLVLKQLAKENQIPEIIDFEGEKLTKREVAIFIITTLSDWLSQWSHFQDDLFQIEKRHALGKDLASFFEEFMQDKNNITLQNAASIWPQSCSRISVAHLVSTQSSLDQM
jgi:hypothetical protein